jgi:hypothetical protein
LFSSKLEYREKKLRIGVSTIIGLKRGKYNTKINAKLDFDVLSFAHNGPEKRGKEARLLLGSMGRKKKSIVS